MITSDQETRSAADVQNLLLKDHQYFADSYWKNELSGETRVNWLIGATTATAAGLVALAAKEQPPPRLRTLTVMAFSLLLSFGILTTFRLLKRNESTDSYTEGLDNIRKLFRDHFDRDQVLAHYDPFRPRDAPTNINYRRFGGLAYFAAILDSILLTAIVLSLFYDSKNQLLPMAFSGVIFASA